MIVYPFSFIKQPTSGWSPANLSNLWDWWTASDGVNTSGSDVTSWDGYNGNILLPLAGYASYISNDANYNNEPSVLFNPNFNQFDSGYVLAANTNNTSKCIILVGKLILKVTSNANAIYALGSTSFPRFAMFNSPPSTQIDYYDASGGYNTSTTSYFSDGDYIFIRMNYDRTTGVINYYESSANTFNNIVGTYTVASGQNYTSGYYNVLGYGNQYGATPKMSVVELLYLDGIPSSTELTELSTYITNKYGI